MKKTKTVRLTDTIRVTLTVDTDGESTHTHFEIFCDDFSMYRFSIEEPHEYEMDMECDE